MEDLLKEWGVDDATIIASFKGECVKVSRADGVRLPGLESFLFARFRSTFRRLVVSCRTVAESLGRRNQTCRQSTNYFAAAAPNKPSLGQPDQPRLFRPSSAGLCSI